MSSPLDLVTLPLRVADDLAPIAGAVSRIPAVADDLADVRSQRVPVAGRLDSSARPPTSRRAGRDARRPRRRARRLREDLSGLPFVGKS
jgi:hypothetical protein